MPLSAGRSDATMRSGEDKHPLAVVTIVKATANPRTSSRGRRTLIRRTIRAQRGGREVRVRCSSPAQPTQPLAHFPEIQGDRSRCRLPPHSYQSRRERQGNSNCHEPAAPPVNREIRRHKKSPQPEGCGDFLSQAQEPPSPNRSALDSSEALGSHGHGILTRGRSLVGRQGTVVGAETEPEGQ